MANNRELSQFANVVGYNGGNIGIGTDNPNGLLALTASSGRLLTLRNSTTGFASGDGSYLALNGSDFQIANAEAANVILYTADTERLSIKSDGDIEYKYDDADTDAEVGATQLPHGLRIYNTNNTLGRLAGIHFSHGSAGTANAGIFHETTNTASGSTTCLGDLVFYTKNSGVSNMTEKLRIASDGNLGIGTANPTESKIVISHTQTSTVKHLAFKDSTNNWVRKLGVDSSNNFGIFSGDTEHLRITSGGKIGIGNTHSSALLTIGGNSNEVSTPSIRLLDGSDSREVSISNSAGDFIVSTHGTDDAIHGRIKIFESGIIDLDTGGASDTVTNRLRITSDGKLEVKGTRGGTLQPSDDDTLELYTKATSGNASTGGGITFYNHHGGGHVMGGVIHVVKANGTYENSSSNMLFGTRVNGSSVAYRARLTSGGEWHTFSTGVNIDISNTQSSGNNEAFIYARYGSTSMTAGTLSFRVYTNGNVSNTNNSYGSISDQNLKENIIDATSQWDDIKDLQVRKYNFRESTGHQTHTQLGLIAQEVETVSPGLVETTAVREGETVLDADGNQLESIKSINYSVLYMKAIKALQEAQTRIETLETQNTDLLARVTALEGS